MMDSYQQAKAGQLPWEAAAENLAKCTGCEACRAPCEYEQDVPSMLYRARAEAWEQGAVDAGSRALHETYLTRGNPFDVDPHQVLHEQGEDRDFQRKGRVLYWPGCRVLAEAPGSVSATMALFRAVGAEHVSLPSRDDTPACCGAPLRVIGDRTGFEATAAGLKQFFNRQRTWVTPSSSCLGAVRTGYPEVGVRINAEVLHVAEFLLFFRERLAELGKTAMEGMEREDRAIPTIYIHDSCGLHRRLGRADAVHEVIEAVTGHRAVSVVASADDAGCCGAGDFHDLRRPGASKQVGLWSARHHREAGEAWIVTGDATCVGALRLNTKSQRVDDLVGFLVRWLGILDSGDTEAGQ